MVDLLDEAREIAHNHEFAVRQRASMRYNFKVVPTDMKEGDLMQRQVVTLTRIKKN